MTKEEAIKWTKWCISKDKECIQRTIEKGFPAGEIQETLEYYEFVLRSLQSISSAPTGDPLTLEQLRAMEKPTPVWMESKKKTIEGWGGYWCLCARGHIITPGLISMYADKMDGVEFYAYSPAHIREEWEPCWMCSISSGEPAKHLILPETCNGEAKYCPECGRPITPEAWAELEKRLRG